MGRRKIDDAELQRLLAEGLTQAAIAKRFAVSEAAVYQRLKRMKLLTSRVVALERAADVVEQKLDSSDRLRRVQAIVDRELEYAVAQVRQPEANRAALVDMILRLAAEVRHQLALQVTITSALIDLRVVKEFQETVVSVIRDESPDTAQRIVTKLKERRALRPHANLPVLPLSGSDTDVA
jgi:hypothetical protein